MVASPPLVVVIAGPNGAGKSTSAPLLLQNALAVHEFVNADVIASGLSAFHPENVAITAGRMMLRRMKALAAKRADFAFETTLASRTFAPWLDRLRATGYRAQLIFLSLPSPDLAVERVAERVRVGGHQVPSAVVRRRFKVGLRNFFSLYRQRVDAWQMFDNSGLAGPRLIASGSGSGKTPTIEIQNLWENLLEEAR